MRLQITSGQGPSECELAVGKFLDSILEEFKDIIIMEKVEGKYYNTFKSVIIESNEDLSGILGSIKWICESPYRTKHKRKNWFIQVSEVSKIEKNIIDEKYIRYETFRCQGNGGQNVNKVESGVRVFYQSLNISCEATEERTQLMNKKIALKKLKLLIDNMNKESEISNKAGRWKENFELIRGNPVRVYKGINFILSK